MNRGTLVSGSASDAICYAKEMGPYLEEDLRKICSYEFSKDRYIRIMPDASSHYGGNITGFTMIHRDFVVMGLEQQAGCGICCYDIGTGQIDYDRLDSVCRELPDADDDILLRPAFEFDFSGFRFKGAKQIFARLQFTFGALDKGNHFIEIDQDENGRNYLVIHNAHEKSGKVVFEYYKKLALEKKDASIDSYTLEDTFLSGKDMEDYLNDSRLSMELSKCNRRFIAEHIISSMGFEVYDCMDICHHYIDLGDNIVRHGAISAHEGEKVIIPINSRDGVILGKGRGNPEWNYSAPHGAGRLKSRTAARRELNLNDYRKSLESVYSSTVCEKSLDEAPDAYRSIADIADAIEDTVDITRILSPVFNYREV